VKETKLEWTVSYKSKANVRSKVHMVSQTVSTKSHVINERILAELTFRLLSLYDSVMQTSGHFETWLLIPFQALVRQASPSEEWGTLLSRNGTLFLSKNKHPFRPNSFTFAVVTSVFRMQQWFNVHSLKNVFPTLFRYSVIFGWCFVLILHKKNYLKN
jgi:hypothetical protein